MDWEQREHSERKKNEQTNGEIMFLREKKEVCLVVCVLAIASYVNGSSSNSSINRYVFKLSVTIFIYVEL